MERLLDYWRRYTAVSAEACRFVISHGLIEHHPAGEHFMHPDQRKPYWCLVLEGLACGYVLDANSKRYIQWFAEPMHGFTGARHLYTPRKAGHYILFLDHSTILRLPASQMRTAKERFPEVSELLHVLKQQYIDRQDAHISILQQPSAYERYDQFRQHFPDLASRLPTDVQMDFINVSRSHFFAIQNRWLRGN